MGRHSICGMDESTNQMTPVTHPLYRLVVENPEQWGDVQTNIAWLSQAVKVANKLLNIVPYVPAGVENAYETTTLGIRTSPSEWLQITGNTTLFNDTVLWV